MHFFFLLLVPFSVNVIYLCNGIELWVPFILSTCVYRTFILCSVKGKYCSRGSYFRKLIGCSNPIWGKFLCLKFLRWLDVEENKSFPAEEATWILQKQKKKTNLNEPFKIRSMVWGNNRN